VVVSIRPQVLVAPTEGVPAPAVAFALAPGRRDPVRLWAVAMCVAYFYLNSTLTDWVGGWSLGPRYLTLIYPLLSYLMVDWLECASPGPSRKVLPPLLLLGVTWSVLLHLAAMLTWSMPPHWNFLFFPVLELPAYLVFHGQLTPGGGFQGGIVLAAGPVAILLAGRYLSMKRIAPKLLIESSDALGAASYALIGLGGLIFAGVYLMNPLPLGEPGELLSAGMMPLNSIGVGLEVTGAFLVTWTEFFYQTMIAPPRTAQNRSGSVSRSARLRRPSAVTISTQAARRCGTAWSAPGARRRSTSTAG